MSQVPSWVGSQIDLTKTSLAGIFTGLFELAQRSTDPSTRNSAIIFQGKSAIASGWNGGAGGMPLTDHELADRDTKLKLIHHAECAAVCCAAKYGCKTDGGVMLSLWAPCLEKCAPAIIASGIVGLVTYKPLHDRTPERWRESIAEALAMLDRAGVNHWQWNGLLSRPVVHRFNKEDWTPPYREGWDA